MRSYCRLNLCKCEVFKILTPFYQRSNALTSPTRKDLTHQSSTISSAADLWRRKVALFGNLKVRLLHKLTLQVELLLLRKSACFYKLAPELSLYDHDHNHLKYSLQSFCRFILYNFLFD